MREISLVSEFYFRENGRLYLALNCKNQNKTKSSEDDRLNHTSKQKQRIKNKKDEQEQRKHFMDYKDSNRYRFKSSRVARNATE